MTELYAWCFGHKINAKRWRTSGKNGSYSLSLLPRRAEEQTPSLLIFREITRPRGTWQRPPKRRGEKLPFRLKVGVGWKGLASGGLQPEDWVCLYSRERELVWRSDWEAGDVSAGPALYGRRFLGRRVDPP